MYIRILRYDIFRKIVFSGHTRKLHAVGCGGIKSAADSLIHRYGRDAVGDFVIIYRSSDKSAALNGCRY